MKNWDRLKVTENNALQLLTDYTVWKYGETEIMKMRDECTFELDFMDDPDKVYKQIVLWLTFERRDPETGKLAVEEFVEKFVTDNNDLAKRMMGWRNITKDTFLILGNKDDIVFLEDSNKRKFNVQVFPKQVAALYTFGRYVEGRIYPWGKGDLYRFASISKLMKSDEERMRGMGLITPDAVMDWYEKKFKEDAESIIISTRNSSLQSILNKLPSEWINAICVNLGLKKTGKKVEKVKKITTLLLSNRVQDIIGTLPKNSLQVLRLVKQNGGIMRYSDLVKRYNGDDFGLWWEKNPPKTPIGILRIHGLLMVGKFPKGERLYKTAIIPKELMEYLDG